MNYFCCCEAEVPNTPPLPKIDDFVASSVDEPTAAVLPKPDVPRGEDCGVVVAGVCPNPSENALDPEAGLPLGVVVVAAGILAWLFTGNENLGVVVVLLVLGGTLVVEVDVEVPFPNTFLGVSLGLLPNTLPPNTFGTWACGSPKGEELVLFENVVVVFVLLPPNADF